MTFQEMKRSNVEIHVRELKKTSDWILLDMAAVIAGGPPHLTVCLEPITPPSRIFRPSHTCVFLIQLLLSFRNPSGTTKICLNWLLIHFVYS